MISYVIKLMDKDFNKYYVEERDRLKFTLNLFLNIEKPISIREARSNSNKVIENFTLLITYIHFLKPESNLKSIVDKYSSILEEINNFTEIDIKKIYSGLEAGKYELIYETNKYLQFYNVLFDTLDQKDFRAILRIILGSKYIARKGFVRSEEEIDLSDLSWDNMHCVIELNELLKYISSSSKTLINELSKLNSKATKVATVYLDTENRLLNNDQVPYMSIDEKDKKYFSEEMLYYLLLIIQQNQTNEYSKVELELMKHNKKSSAEQVKSVLRKFNLSLDMFMNKDFVIRYCDSSVLLKILQNLKEMNVDLDKLIIEGLEYVLCGSDQSITSQLLRFKNNGYLNEEFLERNIGVFVSEKKYQYFTESGIGLPKPKYDLVVANVDYFKEEKINFSDQSYTPTILLNDVVLNKNIRELQKAYGIFDLEFFLNPNVFDIVDLLIELGYDPKVIDYSNFNGFDMNLVKKRIIIANQINLEIITDKKIAKPILTGEGFLVSDDQLDDYIISDVSLSSEESDGIEFGNRLAMENREELDSNFLVDGNYVFNGVVISRNKVLRNLTALSKTNLERKRMLFVAIVYNSYLSKEEITKIEKAIKEPSYKKQSKNHE